MPRPRRPRLRRHRAYDAIRARILTGEYPPGSVLAEAQLGKSLGTSRTPVREAMMRLHEEGLVEFVPRRGPIVRTLMPQEMHEILLVREALEGLASRLAVNRIPVARIKELRTEWEELKATLSEATLDRLHAKGYELHATIIEAAGNATLARLLDSIRGRLASSRQLYLETLGPLALRRARLTCDEHLRIIASLESGDADSAEHTMEEHLKQLRAEILGGRRDIE